MRALGPISTGASTVAPGSIVASPWVQMPSDSSRAPGVGGRPTRAAQHVDVRLEVLLGRADVEPVRVGAEAEQPAGLLRAGAGRSRAPPTR